MSPSSARRCLQPLLPRAGVDIFSACGGASRCEAVDDSAYTYASGTSMAVPHVAGEQGLPGRGAGRGAGMRAVLGRRRRCAISSALTPAHLPSLAAPSHAGVAAVYLADHPGASPRDVAAALADAATQNKIISSKFKPGTPNRLLYSRLGVSRDVQAASGP